MIINKQYLLNNLWFGENQRQSADRRAFLGVIAGFVTPNVFRVWGTDHSGRWDGNVDFLPMVQQGAKFTFLKCIDGTVPSPLYYENRDRARSAGLLTGPYGWLYRNKDVSGRAQAQAYWERIRTEKKQLPAVIDFEWTKFLGQWSNPTYSDLAIYAEEFIRQSGYKPILYSNAGFMNPLGPIPKVIKELFQAIWVAHYGVILPMLPMGISDWDFHQFAATGDASIISPNDKNKREVDLNYCKDVQTLLRLAGATALPPVEPPPPPIVVEPPARPDVTPEPRLWNAEVLPLFRMTMRTYPIVADDTVIRETSGASVKVYGGEVFKGVLWSGNDYVWMCIDQYPSRPALVGKWVAVRRADGLEKFIKLNSLTIPSMPPVTGNLFRVRKWGDPVLVKEGGLSVSIVGTSNFQAVGLYNKLTGWGGVSNFLTIPRSDITKLMALQVEDEYIDKKPDMWREQKMNWLCKPRGTIYFTKDGPSWSTAEQILWGTIALGGNLVQVDGFEYMTISTPNDPKERLRKMARLSGFRKTDWVRPLVELMARGLVHRCYCAYSGDDFGDSPKGIIYSPFWSPLDWDFAGNAQPQAFYLPADWLEAV